MSKRLEYLLRNGIIAEPVKSNGYPSRGKGPWIKVLFVPSNLKWKIKEERWKVGDIKCLIGDSGSLLLEGGSARTALHVWEHMVETMM